jgi:hypothetical protein
MWPANVLGVGGVKVKSKNGKLGSFHVRQFNTHNTHLLSHMLSHTLSQTPQVTNGSFTIVNPPVSQSSAATMKLKRRKSMCMYCILSIVNE